MLVAAAGLAGGAIPAIAAGTDPPAACQDQPAGTVVVVEGVEVTCEAVAQTSTSPDTGTTATQDPAPAPDTTAAPATPPPAEPAPAPALPTPAAPDAAGDATTPSDAAPSDAARPKSAAEESVADAPAPAPVAAAASRPAATPTAEAQAPQAAAGQRHRSGTRRHRRLRAEAHQTPGDRGAGTQGTAPAPATDTALPAGWSSLDPIVLPAFSAADFPVPAELLPLFQAAGAEYGVPWEILAAINEIETGYGRNAHVSAAGAVGFMQFLPSTWARWGRDADGDRRRDPRNPADAIFSAARYLSAAGGADDLGRAVFAYNHAGWYVEQVLHRARELASLDPGRLTALTDRALAEHRALYEVSGSPFFGAGVVDPSPGQALLMTTAQLTRRVLKDERIDLYACGRQDINDGRIDRRVLATLLFLAESGFHLRVSSLECGHGRLTASGNVSAHSSGAAVDIAAVDGVPILGHQGPGSITGTVVRRLLDLQGLTRPDQIISLMTVEGAANTLALPDHDDHIHVGFARAITLPPS